MPSPHLYPVQLVWTGAQDGPTLNYRSYSRSWRADREGKPPLLGTADVPFRGEPGAWNPEDLLVASLSACHMLSYLALCARKGVEVLAYSDDATGTLSPDGEGGFQMTEVTLRPRVVVSQRSDPDRALALHAQAHTECFIARSVNFPVENRPEVRLSIED